VQLVVGVSDAKISSNPSVTIVTYSLGSCIGVTVYDPVLKIGGMLHFQLPTSTLDPEKARINPTMFADTGMAYLLSQLAAMGVPKNRLKVHVAGAAQILNDEHVFDIGRRNHVAIRKVLWQHGIFIESEQVGGSIPRTIYLRVDSGAFCVKTSGKTTCSSACRRNGGVCISRPSRALALSA
jgi:chemotaxis protein CheD